MDIAWRDCSTELSGMSDRVFHKELLYRLTNSPAECFHRVYDTPDGLEVCLGTTALG